MICMDFFSWFKSMTRGKCNQCEKVRVLDEKYKSCKSCVKEHKKRINQFMIDAQNMINASDKGDEKTFDDIANKYK